MVTDMLTNDRQSRVSYIAKLELHGNPFKHFNRTYKVMTAFQ